MLIVCVSNVGANRAVMDPVEAGLGDRLVGVFDETTPDKSLRTALDGVERVCADNIDIVVGIGGGSALNVARAICSLAPLARSRAEVVETVRKTRKVPSPGDSTDTIPNVAVPTTMAGADVSSGGSVFVAADELAPSSTGSGHVDADVSDPRLMAEYILYDPSLFATTPSSVLASSAMNGFDKGIETLYSRTATHIAKAHSTEGLAHYREGFPNLTAAGGAGNAANGDAAADLAAAAALSDDAVAGGAIDHAVLGTLLVQYGRQTNIIHTFGNAISLHYDVPQGVVHGIVTPHVLRYAFETADAHRDRIADALGIDTVGTSPDTVADAVVDEVTRIRNLLDLPPGSGTSRGLNATISRSSPRGSLTTTSTHATRRASTRLRPTSWPFWSRRGELPRRLLNPRSARTGRREGACSPHALTSWPR